MSAPVPVLGYPSRTAAAVALKDDGYTVPEIVEMIGGNRSNISALICNAEYRRLQREAKAENAPPPKRKPKAKANLPRSETVARFNPRIEAAGIWQSGTQYNLRHPGGAYLNLDGSGTVDTHHYAWIGSREAAGAMRRKSRLAAGMTLVPAKVWRPRDREFERRVLA